MPRLHLTILTTRGSSVSGNQTCMCKRSIKEIKMQEQLNEAAAQTPDSIVLYITC